MGKCFSYMYPDRDNNELGYQEGLQCTHSRLVTIKHSDPSSALYIPPQIESPESRRDTANSWGSFSTTTEVDVPTLSDGDVGHQVLHLLIRRTQARLDLSEVDVLVIGKAPDSAKVRRLLEPLTRDSVMDTLKVDDKHMHNNHAVVRFSQEDGSFILQVLPGPRGESNKNRMRVMPRSEDEAHHMGARSSTRSLKWVDVTDAGHALCPGDSFACNWKDEQCHIVVLDEQAAMLAPLKPHSLGSLRTSTTTAMAKLANCLVRVALYHEPTCKLTKVGSGMVVHKAGLILTASHLIMGQQAPHQLYYGHPPDECFFLIGVHVAEGAATKWGYKAELANDPESLSRPSGYAAKPWLDLAVLKVTATLRTEPESFTALRHGVHPPVLIKATGAAPSSMPCASLGDSKKLSIGEHVTLLGYPAMHGQTAAFAFEGIVNCVQDGHLLTTALMHAGASGGGCINEACEVVGVQSHSFSAGDYAYVRLVHLAVPLITEARQKYGVAP